VPESTIRVLLVDMPKLLSDLLEQAFRTDDAIRVVGVSSSKARLVPDTEATRPDYVVVGMDDDTLPRECRELFAERARLRMLGVAPHDGRVDLFELRPERVPLGRVSPTELVAAVRSATEARPTRDFMQSTQGG
jgi:DNA-binding NarL/FixJ family response regulator